MCLFRCFFIIFSSLLVHVHLSTPLFSIVATAILLACLVVADAFKVPKNPVYRIDSAFSKLEYLREQLDARGWKEAAQGRRSIRWDFYFGPTLPSESMVQSMDASESGASAYAAHQLVNHVQNYENMTTKQSLLANLVAYHAEFYADADHDSAAKSADTAVEARLERPPPGIYEWWPRAYDLELSGDRQRLVADFKRVANQNRRRLEESDQYVVTADGGAEQHAHSDVAEMAVDEEVLRSLPPLQPRVDGVRNVWIAKPSRGTRGVGIRLFDDIDELLAHADEHSSASDDEDETAPFVVQKYIESPLLVKNRKFDIRQFVLVTSLSPLVAFVHELCYLRFCSDAYSARGNISNEFMHLSNAQVQKHAPRRSPIPGNQWSLAQFNAYLAETSARLTARRRRVLDPSSAMGGADDDERCAEDPLYCSADNGASGGARHDFWKVAIRPHIDTIVRSTLRAWPRRADMHRTNSFELLGYDILLDGAYRPHLLEINANPGMHLLTDVVREHHRQVVVDTLRVLLDDDEWRENMHDVQWREEAVGTYQVGGWRLIVADP